MTEAMHGIEDYARKHVEYYRQTLGDGLPVLTKRLAQINSEELFSDEYKKFPLSERLLLKRSCGTSGEWLKVLWDAEDYNKARNNLRDVRKSFYGIEPDARWCGFYTSVYIRNKIHPLKNDVLSSEPNGILFNEVDLDKERLTEYCGTMEKYKPEYLVMNPDTAYLFAKNIRSRAIKIPASIRHIELISPTLRQDWRDFILEAFGIAPVLRYEKTETGCVALECPNKRLQ